MAAPWFQFKYLARKHDIVALSSNYTLYGQMSSRVMAALVDYSPDIEVYSIDESFVGLTGLTSLWPSFTIMGQHIRERVLQWTTLPVCVGIAPTKTLAKLANHIAKKRPGFDGVCDLAALTRREREQLFAEIDVGDVWGVGRRIGARLVAAGIDTVQALRMAPPKWIRAEFGVVMERTVNELRGISCLALEDVAPARQEIVASRSFGQMVSTFDELAEAVTIYISRAAEKLRAQESVAGVVQVFVMTNRFRETDPQYSNAFTVPLISPSSDTRVLMLRSLIDASGVQSSC
jgi:DNA polymerase V